MKNKKNIRKKNTKSKRIYKKIKHGKTDRLKQNWSKIETKKKTLQQLFTKLGDWFKKRERERERAIFCLA